MTDDQRSVCTCHMSEPEILSFARDVIARSERCVCNVGVQECPEHPGRLRTQEEKIAFRKEWDRRVEEGR